MRVHGQVRRSGFPVAGYDLVFQAVGGGLDGDEDDWDFTDVDGRYQVRLPAASYVVRNDDEGPWTTNVVVPRGVDELVVDIDLPLGVIRGRVSREATDRSVMGAEVFALRTSTPAADAITQGLMAHAGRTRTGSDGWFELNDLGPGSYLLLARRGAFATAPIPVVLNDERAQGVELVLHPGHTLEGVVRDPDGHPASMDLFVCPGPRLTSLAQLPIYGGHQSKTTGWFAIEGLQPGVHQVFGFGDTDTGEVALQAVVDFQPGELVELTAPVCGALSVSVADPEGRPVSDAFLDIRAHDGGLVLASLEWLEYGPTTNAEGRLELDDLMPGEYRVAAGWGERLGAQVQVEIRSADVAELELVLD